MKRFFLPLILILAFLLRFIALSSYPLGFNADEASFGYDAYSILHTGQDQWGSFMPIVLKSFGDYKSPVYGYLTIPSVVVFGLTPFATRLPNVIIGTLAVLFTYLLLKQILERYKDNFSFGNISNLALISALLLAVNPWHIMMSRGAFEANLITFFLPAGIYFFLKGLGNSKFFVWSALSFGISLFTYHSAKLITPLVIFGILIIFYKEIRKIRFQKLVPSIIILLIFFVGLVYSFQVGGGSRISERSITQGALEEGAEKKIKLIQQGENSIKAKLFHNKYQVVASRFINNYSQYFSVRFLFVDGSLDSYYGMIRGISVIYIFEGILFVGIIPLLINKKTRFVILPFVVWLLISPLPAALATGTGFSGNRAEGMLPILQILETFGLAGWILIFNKTNKKFSTTVLIIFFIFSIYQTVSFIKSYFKNQSSGVYSGMLYGNLEMGKWLAQNNSGENIILSRGLSEPQMFIAFANKWNPTDFQNSTKSWDLEENNVFWVDQLPEYKLGNYTIRSIDYQVDNLLKDTILVGKPDDFPKDIIPEKTFYLPDGTPNIFIVNMDKTSYAKTN